MVELGGFREGSKVVDGLCYDVVVGKDVVWVEGKGRETSGSRVKGWDSA